jgi:hypothetical protein
MPALEPKHAQLLERSHRPTLPRQDMSGIEALIFIAVVAISVALVLA